MGSGFAKTGLACAAFIAGATMGGAAQADEAKAQTPGEEYIPPIYYSFEGVRHRVETDCTVDSHAEYNERCADSVLFNFSSYADQMGLQQLQQAIQDIHHARRVFGSFRGYRAQQAEACWREPRAMARDENSLSKIPAMQLHLARCKGAFDSISNLLDVPKPYLDPAVVNYIADKLNEIQTGVGAIAEVPSVKF